MLRELTFILDQLMQAGQYKQHSPLFTGRRQTPATHASRDQKHGHLCSADNMRYRAVVIVC